MPSCITATPLAQMPKRTTLRLRLAGRPSVIRPSMTHGAHKTADEERAPKPYLVRNRDIVEETELLIAAPAKAVEHLQSGTWSTVRYARRFGRPISIIRPDGTVIREGLHLQ